MPTAKCILCGTNNAEFVDTGKTTSQVNGCVLCGSYEITWPLTQSIMNKRQNFESILPFLRAHTRQASAQGLHVLITSDNFQQLASGHMHTPVSVKLRRVLEYLARHSKRPGDKVEIETDIWPLFDAVESAEVTYLLSTLGEQEYIVDARGSRWQITAKGWEHLEPTAPGGVPGTCFVAMSFDPALDPAFDFGIRPAVEDDCGMKVVRVDRVEHNGIVNDLILGSIRAAQLIVADVTVQRSGVYFEAGFALGLSRTVIWTCRNDDLKNVHFDTRQYSHVVWTEPADLRARLANRIKATVLQ